MSETKHQTHWQPSASLKTLHEAARLRRTIHRWMERHQVLEVLTPALSRYATTDPNVLSLTVKGSGFVASAESYLHTSPEFPMKRLLCAYPDTDIYQMATVFRAEESGRLHNCQFSMLEYYRTGMDHHALMHDVQSLLQAVFIEYGNSMPAIEYRSYTDEVKKRLGAHPDDAEVAEIQAYFERFGRSFPESLLFEAGPDECAEEPSSGISGALPAESSNLSACLDLFMDEFVVPEFSPSSLTFLSDYPPSQAALARVGVNADGEPVAERFEVFYGSVELGNGFHELADAAQQRTRFEADLAERARRELPAVPVDECLLSALEHGLPPCAGIAVGLDRLLMVLGGYTHIDHVKAIADEYA